MYISTKTEAQNIFRELPIQALHYIYEAYNTVMCLKFKSQLVWKKVHESQFSDLFFPVFILSYFVVK